MGTRAKHYYSNITKKIGIESKSTCDRTAVAIETSNFPRTSSSSTIISFAFMHLRFQISQLFIDARIVSGTFDSLLNLAKHSEIKKRLTHHACSHLFANGSRTNHLCKQLGTKGGKVQKKRMSDLFLKFAICSMSRVAQTLKLVGNPTITLSLSMLMFLLQMSESVGQGSVARLQYIS